MDYVFPADSDPGREWDSVRKHLPRMPIGHRKFRGWTIFRGHLLWEVYEDRGVTATFRDGGGVEGEPRVISDALDILTDWVDSIPAAEVEFRGLRQRAAKEESYRPSRLRHAYAAWPAAAGAAWTVIALAIYGACVVLGGA